MNDLINNLHGGFTSFMVFLYVIYLVLLKTGLLAIPVLLLIRGLFQAYLYRNVADRNRQ